MKNILLVGAGRFGRHIAMQLFQLGHIVHKAVANQFADVVVQLRIGLVQPSSGGDAVGDILEFVWPNL